MANAHEHRGEPLHYYAAPVPRRSYLYYAKSCSLATVIAFACVPSPLFPFAVLAMFVSASSGAIFALRSLRQEDQGRPMAIGLLALNLLVCCIPFVAAVVIVCHLL